MTKQTEQLDSTVTVLKIINEFNSVEAKIQKSRDAIQRNKFKAAEVFLMAAQQHWTGTKKTVEYKLRQGTEILPEDLAEFLDWCKYGEQEWQAARKAANQSHQLTSTYKNAKTALKKAWLMGIKLPEAKSQTELVQKVAEARKQAKAKQPEAKAEGSGDILDMIPDSLAPFLRTVVSTHIGLPEHLQGQFEVALQKLALEFRKAAEDGAEIFEGEVEPSDEELMMIQKQAS